MKKDQRKKTDVEWQGSFVALVTPFKNGVVDYSKLRDVVEFHLRNGTQGLVPCGTTGESATLKFEEKVEMFDIVVKAAKGQCTVVAGVGSNDTATTVQLARAAKQAGVDGVLAVAPYYNRPTQNGLYAHFAKLAESSDLPVMLYNIPSRTGVNIEPETMLRLREFKNIVGVKESTGNLEQATKILWLCGKDFLLFSGEDALTLPLMALGARGVVSVAGNVVPQDIASLCEACLANDWGRAKELHYKLFPLIKALFLETNPAPLKTAMAWMGMIDDELRLPLVGMEEGNREKLRKVMESYGLTSPASHPTPSRRNV